jgi:2-oxoacid dehydrogenases acyltransferase (catalytic domain)
MTSAADLATDDRPAKKRDPARWTGGLPFQLTVGGIGRRPVIENGELEEHEFLSLTISFDHEIIDGAPAARFASRLRQLVEGADGVPVPERATAASATG